MGDLGGVLHGCDTKAREHAKEWRPGVWLNTRGSGTGDLEERSGSRGTQQGWVALRWKVVDQGKARAELRPARRQARLPHSRSLLLPGRER